MENEDIAVDCAELIENVMMEVSMALEDGADALSIAAALMEIANELTASA